MNALTRRESKSNTPERQLTPWSTTTSIGPLLAESKGTYALTFFVSTFVLYPRDTPADRDFLGLLPLFFEDLTLGSPLSLALTATSYLLFGKRECKSQGFESLASVHYGKALQATSLALQDPVKSMTDEILMAVCLLGLYEVHRPITSIIEPFSQFMSHLTYFSGCDRRLCLLHLSAYPLRWCRCIGTATWRRTGDPACEKIICRHQKQCCQSVFHHVRFPTLTCKRFSAPCSSPYR